MGSGTHSIIILAEIIRVHGAFEFVDWLANEPVLGPDEASPSGFGAYLWANTQRETGLDQLPDWDAVTALRTCAGLAMAPDEVDRISDSRDHASMILWMLYVNDVWMVSCPLMSCHIMSYHMVSEMFRNIFQICQKYFRNNSEIIQYNETCQ